MLNGKFKCTRSTGFKTLKEGTVYEFVCGMPIIDECLCEGSVFCDLEDFHDKNPNYTLEEVKETLVTVSPIAYNIENKDGKPLAWVSTEKTCEPYLYISEYEELKLSDVEDLILGLQEAVKLMKKCKN